MGLAEHQTFSMSESDIQGEEPVISSMKAEGNRVSASMLFVPEILFDSLPLKYAGNLRNCWEGNKEGHAYSLFDKFKREKKDPTGANRKEQWVPSLMGTCCTTTSYSHICRAANLSVKFNRSYAACAPTHYGKRQGNTKLVVGCFGEQADMCIQDNRVVPGLLCIGVDDVTTDFVRDGNTSNPQPLEFYTLPSGSVKLSMDAACFCIERCLSKLDLGGPYHPSSSEISSSSDPSCIQSVDDPTLITEKSEQDSPVSVLDKSFEDASPRPAKTNTQPVKPCMQPLHINFDEPSPGQRVKLHAATIRGYSIPSKKHASGAEEYIRKVLAASGLDRYQLALKWHCSTGQVLDTATYTKVESEAESPVKQRLLFDHINEVLLDMCQPYYEFHFWGPLIRPYDTQHVVHKRKLVDEVIDIVKKNIVLREQQAPDLQQKLVVCAMEKFGTWMDIYSELKDVVLEMAEEIEEEVVDECVFELWID